MKIYSPAVALDFFRAAGKPEKVAQGSVFFSENDKARPYFAVEQQVHLVAHEEVRADRKSVV